MNKRSMNNHPQHPQSIWYDEARDAVVIIDQTRLPHEYVLLELQSLEATCHAIVAMQVRGAPLIGVTAAYGVYLALREDSRQLQLALDQLARTRPTAVNLHWALQLMQQGLTGLSGTELVAAALRIARHLEREDVRVCAAIGEHGAAILSGLWQQKKAHGSVLNVLTHCNAGALAAVDWGTALAVVYKATAQGIPVHVWVDETRPRNQGAALTCWELGQRGIPHTLIVDNAGGHLMQQGLVDVCVVGSDRTAVNGDVCNKTGTYLKALAAFDNDIPFYAALPLSTIDFSLQTGVGQIPIEQRSSEEVSHLSGMDDAGNLHTIRIAPQDVAIANYGFDVTPARLITGIITETGFYAATTEALALLQAQAMVIPAAS